MQEKIKILTIGDHKDSTLENYFKDNENIEFLELALNENIEKLNNKLSNRNVVFLRSNKNNFETLLEIGKALKKKGIAIIAMMRSKSVIPPHLNIFLAIFIVFTIIFYRGQRYKIILNCYNRSTNKTASSIEIIFTMVLEGSRSPVVIASNSCIVPRTLMVTLPLPCLYSGIGI